MMMMMMIMSMMIIMIIMMIMTMMMMMMMMIVLTYLDTGGERREDSHKLHDRDYTKNCTSRGPEIVIMIMRPMKTSEIMRRSELTKNTGQSTPEAFTRNRLVRG